MTSNVINLALRRNTRLGKQRQTLSEQLRATSRLPKSDRPIMASNLGRMAARLNEESAISVVKSIFEIAWPGDSTKWAKRKRLVRIPGEDLGDPRDYGSYEAAGAPYLHLAHALAKRSSLSDKEDALKSEQERFVAELLWGTSFRPGASPVDETTADARNLMVQLASTIESQIADTGILKLWETLQASPFRKINLEFAIKNRHFGQNIIPILGTDGELLNFHNAQEFGELFNLHLGWSRPKIFIGWLLRRFVVDLLLPPEEVRLHADHDENPNDPDLKKLESWVDEWAWADEGVNERKNALPSHYFDEDLGHGWAQAEFDIVYGVYARADPDDANGIKIALTFKDCADDEDCTLMLPSDFVDYLKRSGRLFSYLEETANEYSRTYSDCGVFDGFFKHYLPEDVEGEYSFFVQDPHTEKRFNLSKRIRAGNLLGLVSFPEGYDTPNPPMDIILSEMADGEAAWLLVGTRESHFVSDLYEIAGAPVPCRANSIAASLLRNSIFDEEECRLCFRLHEEAKAIADEGLQFFNGVIDFYRRSIK